MNKSIQGDFQICISVPLKVNICQSERVKTHSRDFMTFIFVFEMV